MDFPGDIGLGRSAERWRPFTTACSMPMGSAVPHLGFARLRPVNTVTPGAGALQERGRHRHLQAEGGLDTHPRARKARERRPYPRKARGRPRARNSADGRIHHTAEHGQSNHVVRGRVKLPRAARRVLRDCVCARNCNQEFHRLAQGGRRRHCEPGAGATGLPRITGTWSKYPWPEQRKSDNSAHVTAAWNTRRGATAKWFGT